MSPGVLCSREPDLGSTLLLLKAKNLAKGAGWPTLPRDPNVHWLLRWPKTAWTGLFKIAQSGSLLHVILAVKLYIYSFGEVGDAQLKTRSSHCGGRAFH